MYVLEKYAGRRVFWDGTKLASKHNVPINTPAWWKTQPPKIAFEAVIWNGYQSKIPNLQAMDENMWKNSKLLVFDAPLMYASSFEERMKYLRENIPVDHAFVKLLHPLKVSSKDQIYNDLRGSLHRGSDGLIFRKPGSKYMEHDSFYKLLPKMDIDAVVLSNSPTLKCMDAQGKYYHAQTPTNEEVKPGETVVTIEVTSPQVQGSTKANLVRTRPDLSWPVLCQETYPYYVDKGLSSKATCRACGYQFTKIELRIRTTLLRKMPSSIRPFPINMCMNLQCVVNGAKRYHHRQVEPFIGKIRVPVSVIQELPKIEGFKWIYEKHVQPLE